MRQRAALQMQGPMFGLGAAGCVALITRPSPAPGTEAVLVMTYVVLIIACVIVPPVGESAMIVRPAAVTLVGSVAIVIGDYSAGSIPSPAAGSSALMLGVLAAVSEEALFRRTLFALLEPAGPLTAIIGSAGLFALVHVPAYGTQAIPIDLGAGLLLSWARWASGRWQAPAVIHAVANVVGAVR
jgi:membrane protease YdiL (CAAX protease family)